METHAFLYDLGHLTKYYTQLEGYTELEAIVCLMLFSKTFPSVLVYLSIHLFDGVIDILDQIISFSFFQVVSNCAPDFSS